MVSPRGIVNNQRKLIWHFRCTYTHSVLGWPGRARDHVRSHDAATCCRASLPACKPRRRSRKMAEMAVSGVLFKHPYTRVNGVGNATSSIRMTRRLQSASSSLTSAPSKSGPMTPDMSRHPRFTDSFSSLELASFFAQLRAAIGVSLYRPSFCFFRVWLRFLLFLFRVRVSVPVSRAACRVRPNLLPSSSPPSVHPNTSVNPSHSPRRRNRAQPVRSLSSLRLAQ